MKRGRKAPWPAGLLAIIGLGLSLVGLYPSGAEGQLRDPPLGWDMWDPSWIQRETWQPDRMDRSLRWRMTRHWTFVQFGVPTAYQGARSPMTPTPDTVREGQRLYTGNCTSCHDPSGTGYGEAGLALYPSPALLAHLIRMPRAVDEYLLWAISEGGEPFGTAMPAFKGTLTEEQVWQIIIYMRAGFPKTDQNGQE